MRWIGCFVAVCLLFAGIAADRARLDRYQRNDELDNIPALVKLAARRLEGSRPPSATSAVKLEPFTVAAGHEVARRVRARVEQTHARANTPSSQTYVPFDARGPPRVG